MSPRPCPEGLTLHRRPRVDSPCSNGAVPTHDSLTPCTGHRPTSRGEADMVWEGGTLSRSKADTQHPGPSPGGLCAPQSPLLQARIPKQLPFVRKGSFP